MREKNTGINGPNYGKKLTNEQKEHLSILAKERYEKNNYQHKNEVKEKISKSLINYYKDDNIKNKKSIKVQQYDLNNNLINTFNSINEAAKEMGVAQFSIARASNPDVLNYKTCKGFVWKRI